MFYSNTKKWFSTYFFIILFIFLSLIFLTRYYLVGQAVYGDGIYYYAYSHSIIFDLDLNFKNEYEHRYSPIANNSLEVIDPGHANPDTKTGLYSNKYPIGPGLTFIPPLIIADIISNLIHIITPTFPNNGYSDTYQISVGLFNIFLVVSGLFFLYSLLQLFFSKTISLITVLFVSLGSNLFYYSAIDAVNSHQSSFFFGAIFFYISFSEKIKYKFILLGFISGLLALIRTQDAIFLLFGFLIIIVSTSPLKEKIVNLLKLLLSFLIVFSVQFISWKVIYGSFLAFPYISRYEGFNFLNPQISGVLFNLKTGLFVWTPFYLLSCLGFLLLSQKIPKIILILIFLQIYLISSWSGWTQGESFGVRMLISVLPLFSLGLASLINKLKVKYSLLVLILLITFNFAAIIYFLIFVQNPTINMGSITQDEVFRKIEKLLW